MRMPSASTVISKAKNLFGGGGALNAGFAAWQAMDTYNESRQERRQGRGGRRSLVGSSHANDGSRSRIRYTGRGS